MKVLIISFVFPPCATGAATVMYNLCKNLPQKNFVVITAKKEFGIRWGIYDKDYELDCKTVRLPVRTPTTLDLLIFFLLTIFKGLSINKKERIDCILAVHPYFYDLLGAYVLHKLIRKPFVIYLHDLYSEAKKDALTYRVWVYIERKIFSSASRILVMNEEYRKHYVKRGIRNITIFPPSIDFDYYVRTRNNGTASPTSHIPEEKLLIVYTGSVYAAQESAVLTFLEAVKKVNQVKVLFAVPSEKGYLKDSLKEHLKDVNVGFLSKKECITLQKNADVLFLPLSPNSPYPEEIECAFPCKLLEYLAAGKPILAMVPRKSFVESFIKEYEVGVAVTELSIERVTEAIEELKAEEKRKRYGENALKTVLLFDAKKQSERLFSIIENVVSLGDN